MARLVSFLVAFFGLDPPPHVCPEGIARCTFLNRCERCAENSAVL